MKRSFSVLIRFVIYFLPLAIIAVVYFFQANPFGLTRIYTYDFTKSSLVISKLSPEDRIGPIAKDNGIYYQELRGGLVYFTLNRVHRSHSITLIVDFDAPTTAYFGLGPERRRLKEADFEFRPLVSGGQKNITFAFQASKYFLDDDSLRFAFSVPKSSSIKLYQIKAIYNEPADKWVKTIAAWVKRIK